MTRIDLPAACLALLLAAPSLQAEEKELREVPPTDQVAGITAGWYDAGYRSFVRGWNVPREHWPAVLAAARAVQKKGEDAKEQSPVAVSQQGSDYLHLRFTTRDRRSLLIVSGTKGDLRGYPFKGCKDTFVFAEGASSKLRARLGQIFRAAKTAAD